MPDRSMFKAYRVTLAGVMSPTGKFYHLVQPDAPRTQCYLHFSGFKNKVEFDPTDDCGNFRKEVAGGLKACPKCLDTIGVKAV